MNNNMEFGLNNDDIIGTCIIQDKKIKFLNNQFAEIFEYSQNEMMALLESQLWFYICIHPDLETHYQYKSETKSVKKI